MVVIFIARPRAQLYRARYWYSNFVHPSSVTLRHSVKTSKPIVK